MEYARLSRPKIVCDKISWLLLLKYLSGDFIYKNINLFFYLSALLAFRIGLFNVCSIQEIIRTCIMQIRQFD